MICIEEIIRKIKYCEDNEITNFREICIGNMKKGTIYRGSYPIFKIDEHRGVRYGFWSL